MRLVRSAGPRVHVAFEEGTQAQWLHDLLAPHAETIVVCNIRGKSESGNKSDRLDADELSEQLRAGTLRAVFHGTSNVLTLKELVRSYNNLVEDATRVMQRLKALFRARAIQTRGTGVYRPSERNEWLAKLEGGARVRAAALFKQLDVLLALRPAGEGGDDRRGASSAGVEDLAFDPLPGTDPRRRDPRDRPHAFSLPDAKGTSGPTSVWRWSRARVPTKSSSMAGCASASVRRSREGSTAITIRFSRRSSRELRMPRPRDRVRCATSTKPRSPAAFVTNLPR